MKAILLRICAVIMAFALTTMSGQAREFAAQIIDAQTGAGIPNAIVTVDGHAHSADASGRIALDITDNAIGLRAPGYRREIVALGDLASGPGQIRLKPFAPKALYLSFYGIGSATLRGAALKLIHDTELNAVVIDIKGDRGLVAYRSKVPLATKIGAQRTITISDLTGLLRSLHEQQIYAIARIVVFKDDPLATARPDLAIRRKDGSVFRDRGGMAWVDPTRRDVWDYNIALAAEAAEAGFDEIQFDYLRFPDEPNVQLPLPNSLATRTGAIDGFLDAARERLVPDNVFLAADVFGYVCWNRDDTHIGQQLEDILSRVDYVSPMLYPSGFQFGIPGDPNPVTHVYDVVSRSLERIRTRTQASPQRIRPWLQAFKDYAFDRRQFGAAEIRDQIRAAEEFGSGGWMLWNPRNVYSEEGLEPTLSYR